MCLPCACPSEENRCTVKRCQSHQTARTGPGSAHVPAHAHIGDENTAKIRVAPTTLHAGRPCRPPPRVRTRPCSSRLAKPQCTSLVRSPAVQLPEPSRRPCRQRPFSMSSSMSCRSPRRRTSCAEPAVGAHADSAGRPRAPARRPHPQCGHGEGRRHGSCSSLLRAIRRAPTRASRRQRPLRPSRPRRRWRRRAPARGRRRACRRP